MKADLLRSEVTTKLIDLMQSGTSRPVCQPWNMGDNVGVPTSAATGKPYRGSNAISLDITSMVTGYKSKNWNTFQNWKNVGVFPKAGAKATWGFYYGKFSKEVTDKDGNAKMKSMAAMRTFCLFNAEQCDGKDIQKYLVNEEDKAAYECNYDGFDNLVKRHNITINAGETLAAYVPSQDLIKMPLRGYFQDVVNYYGVLAHEVCHWSEKRALPDLSRKSKEDYAFYELVAEIGSAYLLRELGLPAIETEKTLENSAIYLKSWLEKMKSDTSYIFKAASQAGKIVDYLVGSRPTEENSEPA